ncbi:Xyloglucan-specific Endo-beta-1 4-glucanase BoGH9A [termite gut metagenome]|uniref:Xyloglucan-specific Endo-beta-1 4-glucanase BoGH9A n=1 Tax=termite gut metagenome TaxID=433724 RepID=A0A5J4QY43_9ZZZZ
MKSYLIIACLALISIGRLNAQTAKSWIRINQLGYQPNSTKVVVFISTTDNSNTVFNVIDSKTNKPVFENKGSITNAGRWGMKQTLRLNFSSLTTEGEYYIECNDAKSPLFRIDLDVYNGTADFILNYMRQQRCGYNPYLDTVCHQHDGYIVDHPTREGEKIDVRGGWHDASDCLQYLATSANATFQMLFAWQQTPDKTIYKDEYAADGRKGANGIPDILDEVRWGLDWMICMNPDSTLMFNQIADDRDRANMRLPNHDPVDYGYGVGLGHPVYPVTGKPQGLRKNNQNRSTGVSSSAAKFASAFALGSEVFRDIDPELSILLKEKSEPAYRYGKKYPGNNQTACTVSPYFYEEDNWVDDMELAAATEYNLTGSKTWLADADYWGQLEEITPWMELGRARHYQFYPFVNLGHYYLSQSSNKEISEKYTDYMKRGLECLAKRAKEFDDPFLNGVPFAWCSNNLITAAITYARLYHQVSGDDTYLEMEAALRDWLFGCNPWGTSMICGLPSKGNSPTRTHSYVTELLNDITYGGLVDGPIERARYESLRGIGLKYEDEYAPFQKGAAVYHDDPGDYSSNEPTMDGTASLSFYLSTMEKTGKTAARSANYTYDDQGAIVRLGANQKVIHLIFSADSAFEGAPVILKTLDKYKATASFFLTGNCLRMSEHKDIIKKIISKGHYVGGHSDKHLLYAPWDKRNELLVGIDSLTADFRQNMSELNKFGINVDKLGYYLPPYEWYNKASVRTVENLGQSTINYTPGINFAADYTTPDMDNYQSSQELIDSLY